MSEPDEAMVEAVAKAIAAHFFPHQSWESFREDFRVGYRNIARAALSVPVVRDALARDAQVREIVAKARAEVEAIPGGDSAAWAAADAGFSIAALYDRDDSEEQR